jgi:hypothetical protein
MSVSCAPRAREAYVCTRAPVPPVPLVAVVGPPEEPPLPPLQVIRYVPAAVTVICIEAV